MAKEFDRKGWIKNGLRRMSYKYPTRNLAKINARVERGKYRCSHCLEVFGNKYIQLDHLEPVIDPLATEFTWNSYVERMFPPLSGWSVLCIGCHEKKSKEENALRREVKKKNIDKPESN